MADTIVRLGTALALVTAGAGIAYAQPHLPGGGAPPHAAVPHAAAPAPHISAPAAPHFNAPAAPHFNAAPHMAAQPHFNAAPHIAAQPRFNAAPHIGGAPHFNAAPRFSAAPHFNTHAATPRFNAPRAAHMNVPHQQFGHARGFAGTRQLAQPRIGGRETGRHALHAPSGARSLARGANENRLSRQALHGSQGAPRGPMRTETPTRMHTGTATQTSGRPNPGGNAGGTNRAFRPTAGSNRIAAFRAPLGMRNINHNDRLRFFADRRRFFHHGGFIGWFGPVFWPYAYDDVFDYAFWPYEYDDYGYWAYAYDDLMDSVLWAPAYGDVYAYASGGGSSRGRHTRLGSASADDTSRAATQICQTNDPGLAQWPVDQIAQTVGPTPDQQKLLDDLKAASEQAMKMLQAACPSTPTSTPVGRLDAIIDRLDAMQQALDVVRPALAKFYDSLTDEQKARFNAMGRQNERTAQGGDKPKTEARLCGQAPVALSDDTMHRIEREVRPSGEQRDGLERLREASAKAADMLHNACPDQTPLTPVARVDAMKKRVQAMLDAANTVRPELSRFYGSLSDEQKAHFNVMRQG